MTYLEDHSTEGCAVLSEGDARVFGYVPRIRDTGLDVDTMTADYRLLVEGEHRVIGYEPGPRVIDTVAPIVGIVMGCAASDCSAQATTFISICSAVCGCREWVCAGHAAMWA